MNDPVDNKVGLREYFEKVFQEKEKHLDEKDKRLDERWHAQEAARVKAESQLNARLELLNELRTDVITRTEYDAKHDALTAQVNGAVNRVTGRVEILEKVFAEFRGRAVTIGFFMLVGGGALGALVSHLIK